MAGEGFGLRGADARPGRKRAPSARSARSAGRHAIASTPHHRDLALAAPSDRLASAQGIAVGVALGTLFWIAAACTALAVRSTLGG